MYLFNDISGLLFPRVCVCCEVVLNSFEKHLCLTCHADLPIMSQVISANPLNRIFNGKIKLENATSYLEFENGSKTQKIVHELKYNNNPQLATYMGKLMGLALKQLYKDLNIDIIVPVPLHYVKSIKRGYNQAEKIANGLSGILGPTLHNDMIKRVKRTSSQTKKTRYERWMNVSSVFLIESKTNYHPKHVLLIDDVITTGATIEACAACLINHFECKVSAVSLARAT